MATVGTVREWRDGEGWGVIDSADTPGGCWTHYSQVAVPGYRSLPAGQVVELEWEAPGQDGYPYRAVRVWPYGHEPVDTVPTEGPSEPYRSTLAIDRDG
ncbi:MAG: hypothetical protein ACR2KO_01140 [Geodermatophilaceae bacterium]|jgi:CspA family cold shock protein|nr:cold shock domain-containing protein [Geodermatophilaceae bacterium]